MTARRAGMVAGLAAGLPFLLVVSAHAAVAGPGATLPAAWIGATIYGDDAMQGGGQAVAAGLAVHAAVSAVLGALYERLTRGRLRAPGPAAAAGLAFGAAAGLLMTLVIVPRANPFLAERIATARIAWIGASLAFGLALAFALRALRAHPPD